MKNKQEKDKRRNYWLSKQGWRILRFRANDAIPTPQQIKDGIDYLIQTGHSLHYVNLDMSKLQKYDFWLAHYTGATQSNPLLKPSDYKGNYAVWQYTSKREN